MRRSLGLLLGSLALLALHIPASAQKTDEKTPANFTFLHITDTHQTSGGSLDPLQKLVGDALQMSPRPAFIVDTGDVTEAGRPEEYARFKQALAPLDAAGVKFYAVPGNHDVRWSPDGKEGFVKAFGKLYQSFDYGGAHFVLLDSTVALEHWGHFDKAELDWLSRDLKRVRPETPTFLFLHHFIGRDTPSVRMVDNEFDLNPILRGRNVVAIFTGHGHQDLTWKTNGVTTVMARGLYQGSYHRVQVSPLLVTLERVTKEAPDAPTVIASLPVARKAKPSLLRAGWDDPDVPFLERRRPAATLDPRAVADNPDKEKGEYRLNDGAWQPMTKDARDIWRDQFMTKSIPLGVNAADVRLTTSNAVTYMDELIFEVERGTDEAGQKWAINLDGPIQSSPLLNGNSLYVSSLDGRVYALDIANGKRRWAFPTKGQFLASPVLNGDTLYVGGTDHVFYALDAQTGKPRWRYETGGPIFATAAVAKNIVCIGGSGKIYGLDAATGALKWTQNAGGFFQSRAAADGDTFYLGGWDNNLYALDAATGTPRWTARLGRSFYYAPAIASPAVANGRVYVASNDNVLHALDAKTGNEQWKASAPPGGDAFGYSSPVASGLDVFIGGLGDKGDVYDLEGATGAIRWRVSTGQAIYDSSPRVAPNAQSLAIMGVRGRVSVLDVRAGRRLWGYELGPGNVFSTPEYDGRIVYTTTMANDVQALNGPGVAINPARAPRPKVTTKTASEAKP